MNRATLKGFYFIPCEIESLEQCKIKYSQTLGDRAGGLIVNLDKTIEKLQQQHKETGAFLESIHDKDIRAIIEHRYKAREDWATVFKKVYPGAHSSDPAQYCKRKLDRYLQKREEKSMKKDIVNAAETFFPDDPIEEAPATGEAITPTKAKRQKMAVITERKSARLQLLIRPSTKDALRMIAESRGQSVNDLINEVLENFVDAEEAKAERK